MSESADTAESKVTCVFVHGWAMNSAVWQDCLACLPAWVDAIVVDLPGHGSMADVTAASLDDYVRVVATLVNRPVVWVGWSLGGLVTLKLAERYPERVAGLFQVAATPCFVQRPEWPHAVKTGVFEQFAGALSEDVERTLKQFLALQVMGDSDARQSMKVLQAAISSRGLPSQQALQSGLSILQQTDLRDLLGHMRTPVEWLLGAQDALVPVAVGADLQNLNPYIELHTQAHAGHAPFISHPQEFATYLSNFLQKVTS